MEAEVIGYHFGGTDRTLGYGDGRTIVTGETLTVAGEIIPCQHGLHASPTIYAALMNACGPVLARVRLSGTIVPHGTPVDKWAASERTELLCRDATPLLQVYARQCALEVIDLWEAPAVVREWLATGNEELHVAALAEAHRAYHAAAAARPAAVAYATGAAEAAAMGTGDDTAIYAAGSAAAAAASAALSHSAALYIPLHRRQEERLQHWGKAFLESGTLPTIQPSTDRGA